MEDIDTNNDGEIDIQAGEDWCFAYGEEEWVEGEEFSKAKEQTERFIFGRNRPDDINYEVECT